MGKRYAEPDFHLVETPQKQMKKADTTETTINDSVDECQDFVLSRDIVEDAILTDLCQKQWRVGKPIGKGSFGEIFLVSDDITRPVSKDKAKYVVKIEPHSNGPLFVEIHCLINIAKATAEQPLPPGMPEYIASGSHNFQNSKYRFLILPRYKCDLHSIIKDKRVDQKNLVIIGCQVLDALEHIHDRGYAHSDVKAENLMLGEWTYRKSTKTTTAAGARKTTATTTTTTNRSTTISFASNLNDDSILDISSDDNSDDDDDDHSDNSENAFRRPQQRQIKRTEIQFSGSNPVRSCRMARKNSTYLDMVNTHYLRPTKKVNYTQSDDEMDVDDATYWKRVLTRVNNGNGTNNGGCNSNNNNINSIRNGCSNISNNNSNSNCNNRIVAKKVTDHKTMDSKRTSFSSCSSSSSSLSITEDRIFLIDFGLASKFVDSSGNHRQFCMDQRRAHDGTLEFTSRDAHMGAHSRRSDLECLGYNLMYWYQGSLPWKDTKLMTQPEQVHRMKEYFMTDVRKVYKDIYASDIPKFLSDYLEYVVSLAYHDRPDYDHCRRILCGGIKPQRGNAANANANNCMILNLNELKKRCHPISNADNNHVRLKDVTEMMKLGMREPFKENGSAVARISPKNLRSKSEKIPKKQRKKFSWTDILSTDPDQIARQRAEKEYARDSADTPLLSRYKGKPTYAILEVQNRMKFKDRLDIKDDLDKSIDIDPIKGYTKPMMDILRKKQISLLSQQHQQQQQQQQQQQNHHQQRQHQDERKKCIVATPVSMSTTANAVTTSVQKRHLKSTRLRRSNPNIITTTTTTPLSIIPKSLTQPATTATTTPTPIKTIRFETNIVRTRRKANSEFTPTDESSCGSTTTDDSVRQQNTRRYRNRYNQTLTTVIASPPQKHNHSSPNVNAAATTTTTTTSASDDDSNDATYYYPNCNRRRPTRRTTETIKKRMQRMNKKTVKEEHVKQQRVSPRG